MKPLIKSFVIHGRTVHPKLTQEGQEVDKIPPAVYKVKESLFGYYLEAQTNYFNVPEKIYGQTLNRVSRIMNGYSKATSAFNIGLFGSKGAGKSLLASVLGNTCIQQGIPVIDVSDSFEANEGYINFIESIGDCCIIFDEFLKRLGKTDEPCNSESDAREKEKIVANRNQNKILNFFQGTGSIKRLMVLIDNSKQNLNEFFKDRPGRMYYTFNYRNIEEAVVREYCADKGLSDELTDEFVKYSHQYHITFDSMQALVEEHLAYPSDSLEELTQILNVPTMFVVKDLDVDIVSTSDLSEKYEIDPKAVLDFKSNSITISYSYTNELYREVPLTEKEYQTLKDSDGDLVSDSYSWNRFNKLQKIKVLEDTERLHAGDLISIKGNTRTYRFSGGTITVKIDDINSASYYDIF